MGQVSNLHTIQQTTSCTREIDSIPDSKHYACMYKSEVVGNICCDYYGIQY